MALPNKRFILDKLGELFRFIHIISGSINISVHNDDERGNTNVITCKCDDPMIIDALSNRVTKLKYCLLNNKYGCTLSQYKVDENNYVLIITIYLDCIIFSDVNCTNSFAMIEANDNY